MDRTEVERGRQNVSELPTGELIQTLLDLKIPGPVSLGYKLESEVSLRDLPDATLPELREVFSDIDYPDYQKLLAGVELGRRVFEAKERYEPRRKLKGTDDARLFCERRFSRLKTDGKREEFHIVTLDTKNFVIGTHLISIGTLDASLVHPREVFKPAIRDSASAFIAVHNHPSGDPTPSKADLAVTRRLEDAGKTIGIELLDHIVIGQMGSVSIQEQRNSR